jgi:hypothetical protein
MDLCRPVGAQFYSCLFPRACALGYEIPALQALRKKTCSVCRTRIAGKDSFFFGSLPEKEKIFSSLFLCASVSLWLIFFSVGGGGVVGEAAGGGGDDIADRGVELDVGWEEIFHVVREKEFVGFEIGEEFFDS